MKKIITISVFAILWLLPSCKPTEKGYKSAYDAALGKRETVKSDIDIDLPEGALQSADGPQLKEIDGQKVYVLNQRIKPVEDNTRLPGSYNVAVGTYKMITNCKSQSEALKEEGYAAFPVKDNSDMYFTIIGSFDNMKEAIQCSQLYQKSKDRVYVGLPSAPVIIFSPR